MIGIGVVFDLTCAAMSTVDGMFGLVIGVAALRIGGPGALSLASMVLPRRWFVRRRGLALGLLLLVSIVLLLLIAPIPLLIPVYAIIVGIAMGSNATHSSVIWPTYLGGRHEATHRSKDSGVKMISAAVGPLALAFDCSGLLRH